MPHGSLVVHYHYRSCMMLVLKFHRKFLPETKPASSHLEINGLEYDDISFWGKISAYFQGLYLLLDSGERHFFAKLCPFKVHPQPL